MLKPPHPWYVFRLTDRELFAFAGLYDIWTDPKTGEELYSYTIITTEPNELVGKVHPRMPAILTKEQEDLWLNPDLTEPDFFLPALSRRKLSGQFCSTVASAIGLGKLEKCRVGSYGELASIGGVA